MDVNTLIAQAHNTEGLEDQTDVSSGGDFEYEVPPAGPTPARFIGYVEVGKRKQRPYQGKEKPDADELRLYFELNGPKHKREVEVDGEDKTFTNMLAVKVTKKLSDKATFHKLFNKMTYGRDSITHMANMLGEGFLVTVEHAEEKNPKEGQKPRTFTNIRDKDGNWLIGAPSYTDPISSETHDVPVPEATQPLKLLLWDNPTQEQWDSIFIDGTRTVKDDKGVEKEVSKNWLQEDIVSNSQNFEGSALQALLGGVGDLTMTEDVIEYAAPEAPDMGNASADADKDTPAPSTENAASPDAEQSESEKPSETDADAASDANETLKALGLA